MPSFRSGASLQSTVADHLLPAPAAGNGSRRILRLPLILRELQLKPGPPRNLSIERIGHVVCSNCRALKFHKIQKSTSLSAFTLAEVAVAIAIIAIVFTSGVMALTKANSIASASRNSTGAYTAALKRIDWIQSVGPFNPQKGQIPQETKTYSDNTSAVVARLTPGTYTENEVAIYNDPPGNVVNGVFTFLGLAQNATPTFGGIITTTVADVSPTAGVAPYIYSATVTVQWKYRDKNPSSTNYNYSLTMKTLRSSDE